MPFVLPLWLLLAPVVIYGVVAYGRRADLGKPLPVRGKLRYNAPGLMSGYGYMGFAALSDLNRLAGGVVDQAVYFALAGSMAYLYAACAEAVNPSVASDLLTKMLKDIGSLGYLGAIAAILLQGERGLPLTVFMVTAMGAGWLGNRFARSRGEPQVQANTVGNERPGDVRPV